MKYLLSFLPLLALVSTLSADEPVHERIEWIDIWVTDADKDELPRVLLVGDSITRGYFGNTEKLLAGQAYCARLTTSKCVADPTFVNDLQLLLKQYRFSVIHFNNGLHGWGYTEEEYAEGMRKTISALQAHNNVQLIWATTTPVRDRANLQQFTDRTERVKQRNQLVSEIIKEQDILSNDLFELVKDYPEWQSSDGVHFNSQGNQALSQQVSESVKKALPAPARVQ